MAAVTEAGIVTFTAEPLMQAGAQFSGATVTFSAAPTVSGSALVTAVDVSFAGAAKEACVCATTADIVNIASVLANDAAFDGLTLTNGQRVLLTAQDPDSENGIYIWNTGDTVTRAVDMAAATEVPKGTRVFISSGTLNAGAVFEQTAAVSTVATDTMTWAATPRVNILADGSAVSPGLGFDGDIDTGLYLNSGVGVAFGGAEIGTFVTGGLTMASGKHVTLQGSADLILGAGGLVIADDGTSSLPAIVFNSGQLSTGIYSSAGVSVAVAIGGSAIGGFLAAGLTMESGLDVTLQGAGDVVLASGGVVIADDGSAATPAIVFGAAALTTGIYSAAGLVGIGISGSSIATFASTGLTIPTGGDVLIADAPTAASHAANKLYVDAIVNHFPLIGVVDGTGSITLDIVAPFTLGTDNHIDHSTILTSGNLTVGARDLIVWGDPLGGDVAAIGDETDLNGASDLGASQHDLVRLVAGYLHEVHVVVTMNQPVGGVISKESGVHIVIYSDPDATRAEDANQFTYVDGASPSATNCLSSYQFHRTVGTGRATHNITFMYDCRAGAVNAARYVAVYPTMDDEDITTDLVVVTPGTYMSVKSFPG
jgi:hypothetical protein